MKSNGSSFDGMGYLLVGIMFLVSAIVTAIVSAILAIAGANLWALPFVCILISIIAFIMYNVKKKEHLEKERIEEEKRQAKEERQQEEHRVAREKRQREYEAERAIILERVHSDVVERIMELTDYDENQIRAMINDSGLSIDEETLGIVQNMLLMI